MSAYFSLVALIWLLVALRFFRDVRAIPSLPQRVDVGVPPHERVSVVIAARDEKTRIETTLRRLMGQDVARSLAR